MLPLRCLFSALDPPSPQHNRQSCENSGNKTTCSGRSGVKWQRTHPTNESWATFAPASLELDRRSGYQRTWLQYARRLKFLDRTNLSRWLAATSRPSQSISRPSLAMQPLYPAPLRPMMTPAVPPKDTALMPLPPHSLMSPMHFILVSEHRALHDHTSPLKNAPRSFQFCRRVRHSEKLVDRLSLRNSGGCCYFTMSWL
jgi:hypothetical protein